MEKVRQGEQVVIKASTWNGFVDAANFVKEARQNSLGAGLRSGVGGGIVLLKNMEDMGSDSGTLTMTITVTLEDKELDDGDEHTVPEFKHKIKSGFQVQHDCEGEMEGDYVLEKGKDGNYQLSLLTEQLDMLEEDEEEDAEDPEEID